jgi:two-component system, OmpR family, KDP operon response regulator KdpE
MPMPTLLVLDKDRQPGVLREALLTQEYSIVELHSCKNALEFVRTASPDLIIFGIALHRADGLESFRAIRDSCDIPLIVLCARDCEQECALALDLGADDCIVEPFASKELLARVRVQLRRSCRDKEMTVYSNEEIAIDCPRRLVTVRGHQIHLPRKQFDLLKYLIAYRGNPVSSQVLSELVWGTDSNDHTDNLRVLISQLRKMIERQPEHPKYILTEPKVGYRFESIPENTFAEARDFEALKSRGSG